MRTHRPFLSLMLLCAACLPSFARGDARAAEDAAFAAVNRQFAHFDLNRDGTPEIRWVRELGQSAVPPGRSRGLVLIIVEPRLLPSDAHEAPLAWALNTYAKDLALDGWRVRTAAMQVYDGRVHQDGRTLLAMREYLRALKARVPDLAGLTLVGNFPEAFLVRAYNWRQKQPTVLHDGQPNREDFGGKEVCRIRSRAEMVAARCDVVLSDLDGNWDKLYHFAPEDLQWLMAVYPDLVPPKDTNIEREWFAGGPTKHWETGSDRFQDFFLVNDGRYEMKPLPDGGMDIKMLDSQRDDECSAADKLRGNPMARPDLHFSRINARFAALRPQTALRGVKGEGLLDARGVPQTVTFASERATPRGHTVWEWDPALEQKLLTEFFDRDHRYRHGAFRDQLKPASVAFGLPGFLDEMRQARPEWKDFKEPGYDLQGDDATLAATVEWFKRPAVLRAICCHSDPWGSALKDSTDEALLKACGGKPWNWMRRGNQLVPGLGPSGKLDDAITNTLYHYNVLPDTANLFLHWGCEITSPGGAGDRPYSDPEYAYWQGAEGLMFLCKGIALVGRAKGFYDFPRDFPQQLGLGKTFGEAFEHYYDAESAEKNVDNVGGGIGRKRAYFWAVIGDWSLTLPEAASVR